MNRIKVDTGGKMHIRSLAMCSMLRMCEQKEDFHLQNVSTQYTIK